MKSKGLSTPNLDKYVNGKIPSGILRISVEISQEKWT
jgi:hypothetical protein